MAIDDNDREAEQFIIETVAGDPAGWLGDILDHVPDDRRSRVIAEIREILQLYDDPTAVTAGELATLEALSNASPRLLSQGDISDALPKAEVPSSPRSVAKFMKHLEKLELVNRPRGGRLGYALTPKGTDLLRNQSTD